MLIQLFITAFVLGAVSSFHCVGMCGPIAISVPVHYLPATQKITGIILYNLGRIFTYGVLGLIVGFIGRQAYLVGIQQSVSIILGAVLLIFFAASLFKRSGTFRFRFAERFTHRLQAGIVKYMQQKKRSAMPMLGVANGLLPCGMVYFALTGALASGTVQAGVLFMVAFGAGTFPAMFILSFFGSMIGLHARNRMRKAVPFVMLVMGVLLVLRGLNLNIPYISPYLQAGSPDAISCH